MWRKSFLSIIASTFLLGGCASVSNLPRSIPRNFDKNRVELLSTGKIIVLQKLEPNVNCEIAKANYNIRIYINNTKNKLTTYKSCRFKKGHLTSMSKYNLKKGKYTVAASRHRNKYFAENPILSVLYRNPNFDSKEDESLAGAIPLEADQKIKGSVNYTGGNKTNWIQLKGGTSRVSLTLLNHGEPREIIAPVYALPLGSKTPYYVGSLSHKKTRSFRLKKDNLYVKLMSRDYTGENSYTLLRKDTAVVKSLRVPVIDFYSTGASSSVALLQVVKGMKAQDEVMVFGKKSNGRIVRLGQCLVTAIESNQASCEMNHSHSSKYMKYSAKLVMEAE